MTIAEALSKAVAGGYHMHGSDGMDTDFVGGNSACSAWTRQDNPSMCILDPHTALDGERAPPCPGPCRATGRTPPQVRHSVVSRSLPDLRSCGDLPGTHVSLRVDVP